ncbi:biopolymer transporter ExbD [Archangium gephyra]|uniref:ExbD/TolR family protein n=1 Tax=Archangium gephyra TaxID=48 RepID=UPI0035D5028F
MSTKRKFVKAATPPNSDINVTPLVDVVLVLLIIFMVVTPLLEKDIEVRIPETEDVPMEQMPQDNNQLIVKLDSDGTYSINTEPVQKDEYVNKLKRMLAAKPNKEDRIVFFVADDKANYGLLVAAFDGAKQAGAFVLGMATEDIPAAPAGVPGAPVDPGAAPAPTPAP